MCMGKQLDLLDMHESCDGPSNFVLNEIPDCISNTSDHCLGAAFACAKSIETIYRTWLDSVRTALCRVNFHAFSVASFRGSLCRISHMSIGICVCAGTYAGSAVLSVETSRYIYHIRSRDACAFPHRDSAPPCRPRLQSFSHTIRKDTPPFRLVSYVRCACVASNANCLCRPCHNSPRRTGTFSHDGVYTRGNRGDPSSWTANRNWGTSKCTCTARTVHRRR